MAIDKDILKEAIGNLRKDLRGHKGPVVITVESGHDDEEPGAEEEDEGEAGEKKPSAISDALKTLGGK